MSGQLQSEAHVQCNQQLTQVKMSRIQRTLDPGCLAGNLWIIKLPATAEFRYPMT